MKTEVKLEATQRDVVGKKVKTLRKQGQLPAVVYGKGVDPFPIFLNQFEASRILREASSSSLVTLDVEGTEHTTLVRDKQFDVIRGTLMHVDFQVVSLTETLTTSVAVRLVGEAPVLDSYEAMLLTESETLNVEALPQDLPEYIEVDVSQIGELGDAVYVRDIQLGESVTILNDPDEAIVVAISTARREEEEEKAEAMVEEIEPEVIERGRREEEEEG